MTDDPSLFALQTYVAQGFGIVAFLAVFLAVARKWNWRKR